METILKSKQDSSLNESYKVVICDEFICIETFCENGDLEQIIKLPRDVFDAININLKSRELCI